VQDLDCFRNKLDENPLTMIRLFVSCLKHARLKEGEMRKPIVLGVAAPMLLIGASYPMTVQNEAAMTANVPAAVIVSYPACRPGPGDDRCIQLYERGVRASYARWLRRHRGAITETPAMGGPDEAAQIAHHGGHGRAAHRCRDGEADTSGM
jgi:hypothetical protein